MLSGARKSSILAGSKEKRLREISENLRRKIVGPNIHCSPDLTRVE